MTRQEAQRLARGKWGKRAFADENRNAPDPETREIVRQEYMRLKEQQPQPPPPKPEELEYRRKHREWKEQMDRLRGRCMGVKRYRIGEVVDSPFGGIAHIAGDGDSWEEAAQEARLT